jgi:hypothetical protein
METPLHFEQLNAGKGPLIRIIRCDVEEITGADGYGHTAAENRQAPRTLVERD